LLSLIKPTKPKKYLKKTPYRTQTTGTVPIVL